MVELDAIEELKPDDNVLKVIGESKPTMLKVSNEYKSRDICKS